MERRAFLNRSLAVVGGAALAGAAGLPAQAAAPRPPVRLVGPARALSRYPADRAPLQQEPFLR
ncbi:hypothetical protein AB0K74_02005, partial [Streptomyces sp. NPDC056159]